MDKLKAITIVFKYGSRGNEWQEAGLLHAIDAIINMDEKELTCEVVKKLIDEAKEF